MIAFKLWLGVVVLFLGGFVAAYCFLQHVTGRYFAERHSDGATKEFLALIRWTWAIIYAASACGLLFGAVWLAKFALAQ